MAGEGTQASGRRAFGLHALVEARRAEQSELFAKHVNPKFARVLKTIGFDRTYVRGEGAYLWDDRGRRYLDMLSGFGMFNMGRNHPVVKAAIRDYLELDDPWKISLGTTLLPGLLAEKLLSYTPHLRKVYFASTGTECVEAALKFTRCATGREQVIYCEHAFHGLTYGSLSLNGCESFREGFVSFLPGPVAVPFGDLEALERQLAAKPTAAFLVEPIQGKGVYPATPEFLLGAQELCRRYGAKLVLDEVQTGLGRTGEMFAYMHVAGLEPDLILVAKSLSGGFVPAGAVLMREEIFDRVFSRADRCMVHSSTFGQGGLAMACGLAALHVLKTEGLADNAADKGGKLLEGLKEMVPEFELLHSARGRGLMIGIEFGTPRSLGLRAAWAAIHKVNGGLFAQAILMPLLDRHHILSQVAGHDVDIIKLIPPLTLTDEDVAWFLDGFRQVMEEAHRFPGPLWTAARDLIRFAVDNHAAAAARRVAL
ncbi:MAG: aspartate aminotransferase family protein [Gemmatimonadota bacterium]